MTRLQALEVLGLESGASQDDIKRAYRRRALETHPDRGGTAIEFLKVQLAYETLSQASGSDGSASGLDSVLFDRLDAIHNAFITLRRECALFCERTFGELSQALTSTILSYRSYKFLRNNAEHDIRRLWNGTVSRIVAFAEDQVDTIASEHEEWLRTYLDDVIADVQRENEPAWYESSAAGWAAIVAALVMAGVSAYLTNALLLFPAALALCGLVLPIRYGRRFDPRRIVQPLRFKEIQNNSQLGKLDVQRENAARGGSGLGVALGMIFFGPLGAAVGGAVGAVLGWMVRESLEECKQKLYTSAIDNIDRVLPQLEKEFQRRLELTEQAMTDSIKKNFRDNIRAVLALARG